MKTPSEAFGLEVVDVVTVDGTSWTIHRDAYGTFAVLSEDFNQPTDETDYSVWCSSTTAAGDYALCRAIARAAGLEGLHSAGGCAWVDAAE